VRQIEGLHEWEFWFIVAKMKQKSVPGKARHYPTPDKAALFGKRKIRIVREGGAGEGNISELLPPRGHRGLDVVPRNRSGMSRQELIVLHSKNADGCNAR
jgi:hypothetical protein